MEVEGHWRASIQTLQGDGPPEGLPVVHKKPHEAPGEHMGPADVHKGLPGVHQRAPGEHMGQRLPVVHEGAAWDAKKGTGGGYGAGATCGA